MRKYLPIILIFLAIGCTKSQSDTTYTYTCVSTFRPDPFTYVTHDTILYNTTPRDAAAYIRATSVNGWSTTCDR
jgi:hypothetical protein